MPSMNGIICDFVRFYPSISAEKSKKIKFFSDPRHGTQIFEIHKSPPNTDKKLPNTHNPNAIIVLYSLV